MQYAAESLSAKAFLESVDALVSTPFGRGMKEFAEIRGAILGILRMRIIVFWGLCWGSLFMETIMLGYFHRSEANFGLRSR